MNRLQSAMNAHGLDAFVACFAHDYQSDQPAHPSRRSGAVTKYARTGRASSLNRSYSNPHVWKPAVQTAGTEPKRENGCHALRHFFASVLLDAGESIKAVSEYLGHSDPGFTLRVYTHLMPSPPKGPAGPSTPSWRTPMAHR
jgi:integrase